MILGGLFVVLKFHTKRENMTMNMNEKPMMIFEHLQFGEIEYSFTNSLCHTK